MDNQPIDRYTLYIEVDELNNKSKIEKEEEKEEALENEVK